MNNLKHAILPILTALGLFLTTSRALPNSLISNYSAFKLHALGKVEEKPIDLLHSGAGDSIHRTGLSCDKLGKVLFHPKQYATLIHYLKWNGYKEDQACCSSQSRDTLYCDATGKSTKMVWVRWVDFKSQCVRGKSQMSYTIFHWMGISGKKDCIVVGVSPTSLHSFPIRKLIGRNRRPKAAILNFRNVSDESKLAKIVALKRLRQLQSGRVFQVISGRGKRILRKTNRLSSGLIYTIIFNFNKLCFKE